ncbi:MAG: VCBS repeat-containing protein [Bacteroidota bacterium]|nr:VCBS repeat-containing protein [Bacteroidota bacterium]
MRTKYGILFILIILLYTCESNTGSADNTIETYNNYEKVPSSSSGISFINRIEHNLASKSNLFDYDYFYNGSGVGIADFNNDGLKDVFLCANQANNRIYLNKGGLTFEDITEKANINANNKGWSSGVTFADINQDGWIDIYISQGGPYNKEKRKNILLINQGDLTFEEKADEYGLADTGISTQSAFFDYDKDGDLDCIVMNENDYYGLDPERFYKLFENKELLKENSSHLYEQIDGKFIDVTEKAGLLKPSFGLGLCVSDLNNDNWLDIYIANDYYVPDGMYINNGNGTFTDKIKTATKQISFYGMGVDIADVNNDNLKDIYVLDMASSDHVRSKTLMASMNTSNFELITNKLDLHYQYMFNSLQLNLGNNNYHNIAQHSKLAKTDWSWAGLIFDHDNDGYEDILVTNGYRRYGSDNDSRIKINQKKRLYDGKVPLEIKEQLYEELPSEKLPNILYKNSGNLNFKNISQYSDLNEPTFSNGAVYSDLDNDGDQDLIINNIDQEAFIYKNTSIEKNLGNYIKIVPKGNVSENFAKITIKYNDIVKTKESKRVRGYLSAVDNDVHFGVGDNKNIDSIIVEWASGETEKISNVGVNQTINVFEKNASKEINTAQQTNYWFNKTNSTGINYKNIENDFDDFKKEILLPYKQSTLGPSISSGDVNNDDLDDIFIGGSKGQPGQLFIQSGNRYENKRISSFIEDRHYEDMESVFIDIDNDNDLDLYVVSGGNEFNNRSNLLQDRIYLNDGNGNFTKNKQSEISDYTISGKSVSKIDYDKDGDIDLIVGNRIIPQKYPLYEPSIIYENVNGIFKNVTYKTAPEFEDFGIVNKVITTDINNDGWEDFICVGEWTNIGVFINNKGKFKNISTENGLDKIYGWWYNIQETDVNNDGYKDYIVGNIGTNSKYKTNQSKPLKVFADDFDENGTHDLVLSYEYKNEYVPLRGKECSTQQMPFIGEKIPTFDEFATSSIEDIYGEVVTTAYQKKVTEFSSVILVNNGDMTFKVNKLPELAQTIPILSSETYDINKDGYEDIIVAGNIYNTEVETPRLDNQFAVVLLSNKIDNYKAIGPENTGLYTNGNTKSIKMVGDNNPLLIIANNNGNSETFTINDNK